MLLIPALRTNYPEELIVQAVNMAKGALFAPVLVCVRLCTVMLMKYRSLKGS